MGPTSTATIETLLPGSNSHSHTPKATTAAAPTIVTSAARHIARFRALVVDGPRDGRAHDRDLREISLWVERSRNGKREEHLDERQPDSGFVDFGRSVVADASRSDQRVLADDRRNVGELAGRQESTLSRRVLPALVRPHTGFDPDCRHAESQRGVDVGRNAVPDRP